MWHERSDGYFACPTFERQGWNWSAWTSLQGKNDGIVDDSWVTLQHSVEF